MTIDILSMHMVKSMLRKELEYEFSEFDMLCFEDALKIVLSNSLFHVQMSTGILSNSQEG